MGGASSCDIKYIITDNSLTNGRGEILTDFLIIHTNGGTPPNDENIGIFFFIER